MIPEDTPIGTRVFYVWKGKRFVILNGVLKDSNTIELFFPNGDSEYKQIYDWRKLRAFTNYWDAYAFRLKERGPE